MASLPKPDGRIGAGLVAFAFLGIVVGGAFAGLLAETARSGDGARGAFDDYFWRVTGFTLRQGALSTLVSVAPALLVARALGRHPRFPGRGLILRLFAVPLALPAIVAAMGVIAVLGRNGAAAPLLSALGEKPWPGIYGLSGILVAHAFFNMPLAARLLLGSLEAVPADQWRLAAQLGLSPWASFRLVEWPALRAALPAVAGLVFMLCVTSFTIVLTLGGGPGATTLEVAIYQALRFDFDPGRAVALTLAQVALTVLAVTALSRMGGDMRADGNLSVAPRRFIVPGAAERAANALAIGAGLLFVAGPLAAVLSSGLRADLARLAQEPAVHRALATSLALAGASAVLAVAMAWSFSAARGASASGRGSASQPWRRSAAFLSTGGQLHRECFPPSVPLRGPPFPPPEGKESPSPDGFKPFLSPRRGKRWTAKRAGGGKAHSAFAASMLTAGRRALEKLFGTGASFVLVFPPVVIGAGWFLLLRQSEALFAAAPILVLAVNAVMAVPFALNAIRPAYDAADARHDRLCLSLGIRGWNRLRLVDWPVLKRPAGTALAFAAALSLGDLGVIALFGSDSVQTLPYLLLSRMGSYRTADAAGLALLLGLLCLGLMLVADLSGKSDAR